MVSRNKAKWALLVLPLLASSISSAMADTLAGPSGELIVTGVYQPEACYVSLANNGTIDYGRMHASAFSATEYTLLPVKTLTNAITLNCPSTTSVAITTEDNRAATAVMGDDVEYNPLPITTDSLYAPILGLGVDSAANKIGSYISQLQNLKADGANGYFAATEGAAFNTSDSANIKPTLFGGSSSVPGFVFNLYDNSGRVLSAKLYTMDYSVSPQIVPTSKLNLSRDVVLDGSITVSFYYL